MPELQRLYVRVLGDVTDIRSKMSKLERQTEEFGYRMKRTGQALTAGLTVPLAAAGAAATKLASDAEEAANKFEVVMGDSAGRVRDRFRELHDTIPLTMYQMEGLAATIQDLLVPMGVARDEAADMSARFVELAGDLGSFNNIDPAEIMRAFSSGLAGESEPLRRFGVDVRVARLESLALSEGLIEAGQSMDSAARAQATLLAITRDSKDAIGDAARTADSAANQFKFFMRNVKELGVTIGEQLLPVVTPMVQRLNDLVAAAGGLSDSHVRRWIALGTALAVMGPAVLVAGRLTQALVALRVAGISAAAVFGPASLLVVGLGALVGLWVEGKLEAAAMAGELRGLGAAADAAAQSIAGLTNAQAANRLLEVFEQIRRLRLNISMKEALGDPEMEIMPWRLELGRLENELRILQGHVALTAGTPGGGGGTGAGTGTGGAVGIQSRVMDKILSQWKELSRKLDEADIKGVSSGKGGPSRGDGAYALRMAGSYVGGPAGSLLSTAGGIAAGLGTGGLTGAVMVAGEALRGLREMFDSTARTVEAFSRAMQQTLFRLEFLDITNPEQQFYELLNTLIGQVGETIAGVDLTQLTPENFDEFARQIDQFLTGFANLPENWFVNMYGLTYEQLRDSFAALENAADAAANALNETTRVLNAPRGFKVNLLRFNATDASGGPVTGSGPGGGTGRNPPRVQFNGPVYIQTDPDDSPERVWQKFTEGARRAASRGDPDALAFGFGL